MSFTPLSKLVHPLQNPQLFTLTFLFSLFQAQFSLSFLRKTDDILCCLQEAHLTFKGKHDLRENGWKTSSQQRGPGSKQGHYPNMWKSRFQTKIGQKRWEGYFILIEETNNQEDVCVCVCVWPKPGSQHFINNILLGFKIKINSNSVIESGFSTPFFQ